MKTLMNNGYVSGAVLLSPTIDEMREYIEYQKFVARMLIDNDDTRQFKINTDEHNNSLHRFIYNNSRVDKFTKRGKDEAEGTTSYVAPENVNGDTDGDN